MKKPMKKSYLFIPLFIFLLITGIFFVQLIKNSQGDRPTDLESALIGKPLPEFKIQALDESQNYERSDILNGKPFLINVWATWCVTCRQEHQFLNTLAARGIPIVGINYKDDRQKAIRWLASLQNPYTVNLFDNSGSMGLDLGVYGAPETFLVDGNGIIRYRLAGELNEQVWQGVLEPLWLQHGGEKL